MGPSLRNAPRPEVHFLIQFTQPLLSSVGPLSKDMWAYYQADGKPTEGPANGMNTANEQLLLDVEKEPTGKPLHYRLARFNVQGLLEAVEEFRTELGTDQEQARFDDYVIIRFGHVSHASQKQAARMAADHVWADVCLTSNVSTRAISHLHDHSLAALAAEKTHIVLGTDGSGVEHSHMSEEPRRALEVLKATAKGTNRDAPRVDRDGKSLAATADACVTRMLTDSVDYATWMAGKPGGAKP